MLVVQFAIVLTNSRLLVAVRVGATPPSVRFSRARALGLFWQCQMRNHESIFNVVVGMKSRKSGASRAVS